MTVDTHRPVGITILPGEAMSALILPLVEQQAVACAAHLRGVGMRGRRLVIAYRLDAVGAVAVGAACRSGEAGAQQTTPVNAGHVAVDQALLCLVTCATGLDLVDRRDGRCELLNVVDIVRSTVAIGAACIAFVNASTDLAERTSMAVTAYRVTEWLEPFAPVLACHAGVAVRTGMIGMGSRCIGDVRMTARAVQVLRMHSRNEQQ